MSVCRHATNATKRSTTITAAATATYTHPRTQAGGAHPPRSTRVGAPLSPPQAPPDLVAMRSRRVGTSGDASRVFPWPGDRRNARSKGPWGWWEWVGAGQIVQRTTKADTWKKHCIYNVEADETYQIIWARVKLENSACLFVCGSRISWVVCSRWRSTTSTCLHMIVI